MERVLGAEHPYVARCCSNLALCLEDQKKLPEALQFMQQAELIRIKALGPDHPDTKNARLRASAWRRKCRGSSVVVRTVLCAVQMSAGQPSAQRTVRTTPSAVTRLTASAR
jgi:hypothetical protein